MKCLIKTGYSKKDINSFGNMFLLGNGRYGYRGTLEEYRSSEMVNLNVLGFYDRFGDKWREPVNLPNPFYVYVKGASVLENNILNNEFKLDIENGVFYRTTEFEKANIKTTRFVSNFKKDLLVNHIEIEPKEGEIELVFGVDKIISEINGPHFKNAEYSRSQNYVLFKGLTNENKVISTSTKYVFNSEITEEINNKDLIGYKLTSSKKIVIDIFCKIFKNKEPENFNASSFENEFNSHVTSFSERWNLSRVLVDGDEESQFELDYSIYHLLILEDEESLNSIPARGVSGQTYKGAIFWDTEIFILPFLLLTNPVMAKKTLKYRINTLSGAKEKAKKYGFEGAFYAWESQDDGLEKCSEYNVTDAVTGKPVRTYFNEKQIHISGDIVLAIQRYIDITGDSSILDEGGYNVIFEVAKFFLSYATKDEGGFYHLNDVIGPDEYHERINDNAFTNYVALESVKIAIKYYDKNIINIFNENRISKEKLLDFVNNLYLPNKNNDNVLEQFDGYFKLEDVGPAEVKSRVKVPNEYLGGKNGVAYSTKMIKQADVVTLLVLCGKYFTVDEIISNYKYYLPYTEHGSSLSASMYSICGSIVGDSENAYSMFRKSSGIDLGTDQKMYAGGIYIGGTHPASNAGSYLSMIFGFAGLRLENDRIDFVPRLPDKIKKISFKFLFKNKLYSACVSHEKVDCKEIKI